MTFRVHYRPDLKRFEECDKKACKRDPHATVERVPQ